MHTNNFGTDYVIRKLLHCNTIAATVKIIFEIKSSVIADMSVVFDNKKFCLIDLSFCARGVKFLLYFLLKRPRQWSCYLCILMILLWCPGGRGGGNLPEM